MGKRAVAGLLCTSIMAILVTQFFWINLSIPPEYCPTSMSTPVTLPTPAFEPIEDAREGLPLQGPQNSTLGFQKIYYISLPGRTDRQDMMTLIGGHVNLEFTKMDGVNGSDMVPKAYPFDYNLPAEKFPGKKTPRTAQIGCWRAHANVWSHMVLNGISSALIFEDDVDFSVGIRDIMEGVSTQLQNVTGARNGEPYGIVDGNSWDILTLGHCSYRLPTPEFNPAAAEKIRVWVDPHAPESDKFSSYMPDAPSKRLRLLSPSKGSACNHGYAVTRKGAMNLLYNVGGPGHNLDRAKDILLFKQLHQGVLKGFLSVPDIFTQWKVNDWRDTDIQIEWNRPQSPKSGIIGSVREEIIGAFSNRNIWEDYENEKKGPAEEKVLVSGEELELTEEEELLGDR